MKKLLILLLAIVVVLSFTACGAKALADTTHELWVAHGQFLLADGTQNGWNGKDTALYEKSALKAIALKDVKAISEELFNTLSGKDVKYLYTIDLTFGTNDAGWSSRFLKDGKLYNANGSYCFKIAQCTSDVDGDTKVYAEDQWISDPKTAYVEALTPSTVFYPTWQEEKDENGFSWADNPVVTGGAGTYTLVIAQYTNVSAAGQPGYGVGLVLKEAKEGVAYTEVPAEHTYGIVGSFESSGWADGKDIPMTANGENTWTGEVTLKAGDEFKVRVDGNWAVSYGPAEGGNFKVDADGTYIVTLTLDGNEGTVTFTKK